MSVSNSGLQRRHDGPGSGVGEQFGETFAQDAVHASATHAYAVCFIVTTIPPTTPGPTTGVETIPALEAWFHRRTDVEDRIRDLPTTA